MDTPRQTPPDSDPAFDWHAYAERRSFEDLPHPEGAPHAEDRPPPRGPRRGAVDFSALFVLLDAIRRGLPRDLDDQFTRLIREALLTLRSLIDWYLERLDHPRREPRVEDIPID